MDLNAILANVQEISTDFAHDRRARQSRRHLDPADFERLREAGFLLTAVPVEYGGVWEDTRRSLRSVCDILRVLAQGDPSVALVAAMHPAVIKTPGWLLVSEAPAPFAEAWEAQRSWVFESAREGAWWGTIASEPGSGGDLFKSRAVACLESPPLNYRISGQKHFGSGSGIASYMITTAVPEGETDPDWFYMDMRGAPWDGSAGVTLVAAWDGHGMAATQSHGMSFADFPAIRAAWPGVRARRAALKGDTGGCLFSAVIVGVVEVALETARQQLARRHASLRAYEQVEWTRAELEGWLVLQAYEGMLRSVEQHSGQHAMVGKVAVSELAESVLNRLCKVLGGGTYARQSPFGFWLQDVRALGFLRPPWGFAFDLIYDSLSEPEADRADPSPNGSSPNHAASPVLVEAGRGS